MIAGSYEESSRIFPSVSTYHNPINRLQKLQRQHRVPTIKIKQQISQKTIQDEITMAKDKIIYDILVGDQTKNESINKILQENTKDKPILNIYNTQTKDTEYFTYLVDFSKEIESNHTQFEMLCIIVNVDTYEYVEFLIRFRSDLLSRTYFSYFPCEQIFHNDRCCTSRPKERQNLYRHINELVASLRKLKGELTINFLKARFIR